MTACGFVTELVTITPTELKEMTRPCDDRLRFCDSWENNLVKATRYGFSRPCDDRLRFCDSPFFCPIPKKILVSTLWWPLAVLWLFSLRWKSYHHCNKLDLVMTACGFVTHRLPRALLLCCCISRPCDDRLRFCDGKPGGKKHQSYDCTRPCDDRLRFCDLLLQPSWECLNVLFTRPCDDRLRFCDGTKSVQNPV